LILLLTYLAIKLTFSYTEHWDQGKSRTENLKKLWNNILTSWLPKPNVKTPAQRVETDSDSEEEASAANPQHTADANNLASTAHAPAGEEKRSWRTPIKRRANGKHDASQAV
jgi:hypothetical protein